MTNLRKKLVVSVFTLLLAVVAVATTTFAWFTMGKTTEVGGIDLEVQGAEGLLIKVTQVNGQTVGLSEAGLNEFQSKINLGEYLSTLVIDDNKVQLVPLSMDKQLNGETSNTDFSLKRMNGTEQEVQQQITSDEQKAIDDWVRDHKSQYETAEKAKKDAEIEKTAAETANAALVTASTNAVDDFNKLYGPQGSSLIPESSAVVKWTEESIVALANELVKHEGGSSVDNLTAALTTLYNETFLTYIPAGGDEQVTNAETFNTAVAEFKADYTKRLSDKSLNDGKITAQAEIINTQQKNMEDHATGKVEHDAAVARKNKTAKLYVPEYSTSATYNEYFDITFEFLAAVNTQIIFDQITVKKDENFGGFKMPQGMILNGIEYKESDPINEARLANALRIAYVANTFVPKGEQAEGFTAGTAWKKVAPALYDADADKVLNGSKIAAQFGTWDEEFDPEHLESADAVKNSVKYYNTLNNVKVQVPGEYHYDITEAGNYKTSPISATFESQDGFTGYRASATVRIWLEGWDADCFNPIIFDKANLTISFTTQKIN